MIRPTRAEIDLAAVRDNCRALHAILTPGTRMCAVVKANAYGHGDVAVARACLDAGTDRLAVALVEEGVRLREAGIDAPVLVLIEPPPSGAETVVRHGLTPSVSTLPFAQAVSAAAAGRRHAVQLCVDTGMHREGVVHDRALELARDVVRLPGVALEGIWSHFAVADERDHPDTARQLELFADVCEKIAADGIDAPIRHIANSAGAMADGSAHLDMVRFGIAVYGLYPAPWLRDRAVLRPAMRLSSEVGGIRRVAAGEGVSYGLRYAPERDSTIASVPIGYGDGFTRLLSGRADVLVRGRRYPVAGTVTMDQILVDVGDEAVEIGDEVILLGGEITADEIAGRLGTINYEVVTAVAARVPRVYVG